MAATVNDMWSDLRKELVTDDDKIWVYKEYETEEWIVVYVNRKATQPKHPISGDTLPYVSGKTIVRQLSIKTKSAAEALKRLKIQFREFVEK